MLLQKSIINLTQFRQPIYIRPSRPVRSKIIVCAEINNKTTSSFYKKNDLYKYNNKNVIYIAYVGEINDEHIYKYGISGKVFEREFNSHRKHFNLFEMKTVKITDNKDIIEDIFEKEMLIRNIHRSIVINSKKQTELFTVNKSYSFNYIIKLLNRIINDNPSFETLKYIKKIKELEKKIEELEKKSYNSEYIYI